MYLVVFHVVAVNQNIIEVSRAKEVKVLARTVADEVLEDGQGVDESKWHHGIFQGSVASAAGGFPFFSRCHFDLIVALTEIQLATPFSFDRRSNGSWIRGRGYRFFVVRVFNPLYSP